MAARLRERGGAPVRVEFEPIAFGDTQLDAAVRAQIAPGLDPFRDKVLALTSLAAPAQGIASLEGLRHLENLTSLRLPGNEITDLAPLATLGRLNVLDLSDNRIDQLDALSGLEELNVLLLANNRIVDLAPLLGLPNLTVLQIQGNPLGRTAVETQIAQLAERVDVQFTPVTFDDANLRRVVRRELGVAETDSLLTTQLAAVTSLDATAAGIVSLEGIGLLSGLTTLRLSANAVSDLSPLTDLPQLSLLQLAGNQIRDIQPLLEIGSLTVVDLSGNELSRLDTLDLTPLADLTILNLANNHLGDLSSLVALAQTHGTLTEVDLRGNPLSAASISEDIGQLRLAGVDVRYTEIGFEDDALGVAVQNAVSAGDGTPSGDLEADQIASISELDGEDQGIADLEGIQSLMGVEVLRLSGNRIVDVTPLASLGSVKILQLADNVITDLTPLVGMTTLRVLDLEGNPLSAASVLLVEQLREAGIDVRFSLLSFPDAALETAVRQTLGAGIGDPLLPSDLASVTSLVATEVTRLDGIEAMASLQVLRLTRGTVSDLSPLSALEQLAVVDLSGNRIDDVTTLAGLTNLTSVTLTDNDIVRLDELLGLPNLRDLDVRQNPLDLETMVSLRSRSDIAVLFSDITFGDAALGAAIARQVGVDAADSVLFEHVQALTVLDADSLGIVSLEGIGSLAALEVVRLAGNRIDDLTPLSGLENLSVVDLSQNRIDDLTPLETLEALTILLLAQNQITDLAPLVGLASLREVDVRENPLGADAVLDQVQRIAGNVRLTEIDFADASLAAAVLQELQLAADDEIPVGAARALTALDARDRVPKVTDLDGIDQLVGLEILRLSGNGVEDLSPLRGLDGLRVLQLTDNAVSDLTPVGELPSLSILQVEGNLLSRAAADSLIPALQARAVDVAFTQIDFGDSTLKQHVRVRAGGVMDVRPVHPVHALEVTAILVRNAAVSSLRGVEALHNLREARLDSNEVTDLEPLRAADALTTLRLSHNRISDLAPLASLQQLIVLDLASNQIDSTGLAHLDGLTRLNVLHLENNLITDLEPLASAVLPELRLIDVRGNPLGAAAALQIEAIRQRGVEVRMDDDGEEAGDGQADVGGDQEPSG